jgi:hypothetical protein
MVRHLQERGLQAQSFETEYGTQHEPSDGGLDLADASAVQAPVSGALEGAP